MVRKRPCENMNTRISCITRSRVAGSVTDKLTIDKGHFFKKVILL